MGLIIEQELFPLVGLVQRVSLLLVHVELVRHFLAEKREAVPPGFLHFVHRGVGALDQRFDGIAIVREHRDADACRDIGRAIVMLIRLVDRGDEALGDLRRVVRGPRVLEQDSELISAESGRHILPANAALQDGRDVLQQGIADAVSEPVVDRLEAIEVEEQHHS